MYYIVNSSGEKTSTINFQPNIEDLALRGERAIEVADEQALLFDSGYTIDDNGNMIPPVIIPKTVNEIVQEFTFTVQSYLDTTAKTRGYDGILSLCSYATSKNATFAKEGQAGVEWRDAVWAMCYEILAEVQAGTREVPTDIISELPVMNWGE